MRRSTAIRPRRPSRARRPLPCSAAARSPRPRSRATPGSRASAAPARGAATGAGGGSGAEVDRMRHRAVASDARMLEARQDAFRRHLRMLEHVLHRARRRAGNALAEQGFPFDGGARLQRRAEPGHELAGMLGALPHRVEARDRSRAPAGRSARTAPSRSAGVLAEMYRLPLFVGWNPVIPPERMSRADVAPLPVRPDEAGRLHRERAAQQRHAHVLALAGAAALEQGRRDRERQHRGRVEVDGGPVHDLRDRRAFPAPPQIPVMVWRTWS